MTPMFIKEFSASRSERAFRSKPMAQQQTELQTDHFLGEPKLTPRGDGRTWILDEDFQYWMSDENGKGIITITKGLITDFASVPRIFWNIFPPWGKYGNAALLHDCLYQRQTYTKEKTDLIFLEAMWCLGVDYFTRWTIYWAVRLGGQAAWNQHSEENAAKEQRGYDNPA